MDLREEITKAVGHYQLADAALECVERWILEKKFNDLHKRIPPKSVLRQRMEQSNATMDWLADELKATRGGK